MNDSEYGVMLNVKSTGKNTKMDFIGDELNATGLEENNSNSTGINYLDAINLMYYFVKSFHCVCNLRHYLFGHFIKRRHSWH
jgi:hypothetical protein